MTALAIKAIVDSMSSREIASAIWLAIFIAFLLIYKPIWGRLVELLRAFFKPVFLAPLAIAAVYAATEVYLLYRLGWWSIANLKTTILWLVAFAFVTMFEVVTAKNRKAGLGKITREVLSVTGALVFVTELYSFPLWVELIALPIMTSLACLGEVAKYKPEQAPVAKLMGCLTGAIGLFYFVFSVWKTVELWHETATWTNATEFLVPVILSLGFLPFLYGWRAYVAYSDAFTLLPMYGVDKSLVPYARWLAITRIRGDLELLDRWRKSLKSLHPSSKDELKHSVIALLTLKKREAAPPVVQPEDGWSPYLAMQFLTGFGVETGPYHHSFGNEWFASSPMREIGDSVGLSNNLAYYIDGDEHAATAVKLKLNVNNPASAGEAEDMFILHALHLLEQAMSFTAVERLKMKIATLEAFKAGIPFGSVALSREKFAGGVKGGYSRKFEIRRGHQDTV